MESFWRILKNELIHHQRYATRKQAMYDVTEYIEVFYNRQRIEAKTGVPIPCCLRTTLLQQRCAAQRLLVSIIGIRGHMRRLHKSAYYVHEDVRTDIFDGCPGSLQNK